tara:strand:+ start:625 stop:939 length:315 start_codon:yes stop_codon:yes gene_type:complete
MSTFQYKTGLGNTAAYQVSGYPQVNNGTANQTINYDYVTSQVVISNVSGNNISASFDGSGYFTIPSQSISSFRIKCKQVDIGTSAPSAYSVCVALTTIDESELL